MSGPSYDQCPSGVAYDAGCKECETGGDGDGDGDCSPVSRTFVTDVQEDSGAFCELAGTLPLVVPTAAPLVLPLTLIAAGGGASLSGPGAVEFTADALHKAACNLGLIKLAGGANRCRISCEAQYGPPVAPWSAVPGGVFDVSLGGFAADELPPISFEAPLFSPSFAGQPGPVRFRWTVQEVGGGGGPIALYRGFVYGFQIQPVVTRASVNNCEVPIACPSITSITVDTGGGPASWSIGDPPISAGAGAPVTVVATLSGLLPNPALLGSTPPAAVYSPAGPTITWSYVQPPAPQDVNALFGDASSQCSYVLGTVTDGTP